VSAKTYKADADRLFPEGCRCTDCNSGDCDWCRVYSEGPEVYDPDEDDKGDDPVRDYRPGGQFNNSLTIHKG
jgi:hypothetical protein